MPFYGNPWAKYTWNWKCGLDAWEQDTYRGSPPFTLPSGNASIAELFNEG